MDKNEKAVLAKTLGVKPQQIEKLSAFANERWHLAVEKHFSTEKYRAVIFQNKPTPSGCPRYYSIYETSDFSSKEEAITEANALREKIKISQFWARCLDVPQSIFLLLNPLEK